MKEIGQATEIRDYIFHQEGNPMRQAQAIHSLLKTMNQSEIADLLGWSEASVSYKLRLLNLHKDLQTRVALGEIGKVTAYKLAGLPKEQQLKLAPKGKRVHVRELEQQRRDLFMSADILDLVEQDVPTLVPTAKSFAEVELLFVDGSRKNMKLPEGLKLQTPDAVAGITLLRTYTEYKTK